MRSRSFSAETCSAERSAAFSSEAAAGEISNDQPRKIRPRVNLDRHFILLRTGCLRVEHRSLRKYGRPRIPFTVHAGDPLEFLAAQRAIYRPARNSNGST